MGRSSWWRTFPPLLQVLASVGGPPTSGSVGGPCSASPFVGGTTVSSPWGVRPARSLAARPWGARLWWLKPLADRPSGACPFLATLVTRLLVWGACLFPQPRRVLPVFQGCPWGAPSWGLSPAPHLILLQLCHWRPQLPASLLPPLHPSHGHPRLCMLIGLFIQLLGTNLHALLLGWSPSAVPIPSRRSSSMRVPPALAESRFHLGLAG